MSLARDASNLDTQYTVSLSSFFAIESSKPFTAWLQKDPALALEFGLESYLSKVTLLRLSMDFRR